MKMSDMNLGVMRQKPTLLEKIFQHSLATWALTLSPSLCTSDQGCTLLQMYRAAPAPHSSAVVCGNRKCSVLICIFLWLGGKFSPGGKILEVPFISFFSRRLFWILTLRGRVIYLIVREKGKHLWAQPFIVFSLRSNLLLN